MPEQQLNHRQRIEELNQSVIELPFSIPDTPEANLWLLEIEFVDVVEGDIPALQELADRAPSESAKSYLTGIIHLRTVMGG